MVSWSVFCTLASPQKLLMIIGKMWHDSFWNAFEGCSFITCGVCELLMSRTGPLLIYPVLGRNLLISFWSFPVRRNRLKECYPCHRLSRYLCADSVGYAWSSLVWTSTFWRPICTSGSITRSAPKHVSIIDFRVLSVPKSLTKLDRHAGFNHGRRYTTIRHSNATDVDYTVLNLLLQKCQEHASSNVESLTFIFAAADTFLHPILGIWGLLRASRILLKW